MTQNDDHDCRFDPQNCRFEFNYERIKHLFDLGKYILIYELIEHGASDADKINEGVGGYLTRKEFADLLNDLIKHWTIHFFLPFKKECTNNEPLDDILKGIFPNTHILLLLEKKENIT